MRAVSVNSALLVTSHRGNLFVCVCNPHGVVLYQSISWTENAYFSSSHSLEVPPNFITSRQLAGHLGAQGVEWCLRTRARECLHACTHAHLWVSSMLNKTQRISLRAGKKKKGMSDSMTETCGRVESSTVWPSLLLSKHSAESPQHSGKKNTNTHAYTWSIKWKVLVFPSLGWLSNQASGSRAVLQVCILTDKTGIFSYDALTFWFTVSVIFPLRFFFLKQQDSTQRNSWREAEPALGLFHYWAKASSVLSCI